MKSFIVFTALIAGIAAKAAVGTDTTNFNTFDVKERDFADTYGAPAAPVETSWSADPAWSNNLAGDATFNGGNNVGVGLGFNGNLGYNGNNAVATSNGLGAHAMTIITAVLAFLAISQVVKVSFLHHIIFLNLTHFFLSFLGWNPSFRYQKGTFG